MKPVRQRAYQRVEQPAPGEAGQKDRHCPRQEDQSLDELAAVERTVEDKRQAESQEKLEDETSDRPPKRVDERALKDRVAHHGAILTKPHKFGMERREFAQRIGDADDQRHQQNGDNQDERRAKI